MKNPKHKLPMSLLDVIKYGYFQQVRYLVDQGVNLDQKDEDRRSSLMLCAFLEPEEWGVGICRLLIENGATLDFKDKYGLNTFHYAVIYNRLELVRVYLKAIDFDLAEPDKTGNTALHFAVRVGSEAITRLIAQAYVKYKIDFNKRNNEGYTALQEADRLNRRQCARILRTPEVFQDITSLEANLPLEIKTNGELEIDAASSFKSSKKTLSRPRSSMLSRHSSKSSVLSSEYLYRRSPTLYNYEVSRKFGQKEQEDEIPPNEMNKKNLIYCASLKDVRNNPDYLFQSFAHGELNSDGTGRIRTPKRRIRSKSAFVRRCEIESPRIHRNSWRTEFRKLYVHFQYQCTPSYRDTVQLTGNFAGSLPALDKSVTPANSEHAIDEERGKKSRVRSAAMSRQNTDDNLNVGKGRQAQKSGTRKISQNVGHGGKMVTDGSLESSTESINSAVSSKRQPDGKISKSGKENSIGRQSRTANHKTVPSLNVEEITANA